MGLACSGGYLKMQGERIQFYFRGQGGVSSPASLDGSLSGCLSLQK